MHDPFSWLTTPYRWALIAICFAGALALSLVLSSQGKKLRTAAAPEGGLSFQFAWTHDRAVEILRSWRCPEGDLEKRAERQLLIDFGFLIVYPVLFSLACAMLAQARSHSLQEMGIVISWALLAACPLDAGENLALLRMLHRGASTPLAQVAGWCAGLKFLLIFAFLGYAATVALLWLSSWAARPWAH